jgi:poly-gamma-glutamate synthesis protein (capsule biosynthesis protein)
VDIVVLSFHWGIENTQDAHATARSFAHEMVDLGADIILGHHSHFPAGIEVYNGKAIFYSLGNLIFGHSRPRWMDNYLARLTIGARRIERIEILPISGQGAAIAQPIF